MNPNVMGLLMSFAYIGAVLVSGTVLAKILGQSNEFSRKWIHILVGNWVFIAFYYFNSPVWISIVPVFFIVVNYLSYKYNLIPAMERSDNSLGTVWYAVALFVLSSISMHIHMPQVAFAGILVMAYGDGFAALAGKKLGKRRFARFNNKSLAGSLTVFFFAFLIVVLCDLYFYNKISILVAGTVALVAMFTELLGKEGCDNITLPLSVSLFYYFAHLNPPYFYLIMGITFIIVAAAWKLNALTNDGVVSAFMTAVTLFGVGGMSLWGALISFFILGSVQSKIKNNRKKKAKQIERKTGARNWVQVVANSLPATVFVWIALMSGQRDIFLFAAYACFSAAAADTFSSEIGMLSRRKTVSIINLKPVESGLSGGVTVLGLLAGLLGSMIISLFALTSYSFKSYIILVLLGFAGCIVDSVLGATIQRKYVALSGKITEKTMEKGVKLKLFSGLSYVDNNMVNLLNVTFISSISLYFV